MTSSPKTDQPKQTLVKQRIDQHIEEHFWKEHLLLQGSAGPEHTLAMVRKRPHHLKTRGAVLLVHGFGQNRYSWHLPSRSFVNYLAHAGYDVFNLDLRGHGRSQGKSPRSFQEYAHDLSIAVEAVCEIAREEKIFVVGHSLGGGATYAAAPQLTHRLRGIVSVAGVFSYGKGLPVIQGLAQLSRWVLPHFQHAPFDLQWIARPLQKGLPLLEPLIQSARLAPWAKGSFSQEVLREYLALSFDKTSVALLAEIFSWLKAGHFQGDKAAEERFFSVDLPLLVLAGSRDRLNHSDGVRPAFEGSKSKDKTFLELSPKTCGRHFGHVDLILGTHAPSHVWPVVRGWLDRR